MSASPFAAFLNGPSNGSNDGSRQERKRGKAGGIAGAALKRAGLVDEDLGMRDAGSSGPSRNPRNRARKDTRNPGTSGTEGNGKARARVNPMAGRRKKQGNDVMASGTAFNVSRSSRRDDPVPVSEVLRKSGKRKGKQEVDTRGGAESLQARIQGGAPQQSTGRVIATLKRFLQTRWVSESGFLNLEAMAEDPVLKKEGVKPPGSQGAHKDLGNVMWKLSKELFPNMITLSLAKNDLKTLAPIASLPEFLPNLKNLSLQDNDIKWVRDLTFHTVRSRSTVAKFSSLQELILIGNPVHDTAVQAGNQQGYRAEVLGRFPDLRMLDMSPVSQTEQSFAQLPGQAQNKDQVGIARGAAGAGVEVKDFPVKIPNSNFVDKSAEGTVLPFLAKFFQLYDTDRETLRAAYAPDASFSIMTSLPVPPRARSAGYIHTLPRQRDLSWKAYSAVTNHNIMQAGTRPASKGFPKGPGAIVATFNKLPKTTHPLTDPSKFAFDAWMLSNDLIGATIDESGENASKPDQLLFISVHGEFAEAPSQGVRSFSRTFLVAPTPANSSAATAGWPCIVLADQFTVRQYSGTSAWSTSQTTETSAETDRLQGITAAPGLTAEQHALSIQLARQTGLTYPFAIQCLADNGWDPPTALQRFQELKDAGAIPPEAFAS